MLGAIIARARPDFRLLANQYFAGITAVGEAIIPLDVLKRRSATRFNGRALHQAVEWLLSGGCIGIFRPGRSTAAAAAPSAPSSARPVPGRAWPPSVPMPT